MASLAALIPVHAFAGPIPTPWFLVSWWFPDARWVGIFFVSGAAAAAALAMFPKKIPALVPAGFLFLATALGTASVCDEIFVNLEHTWNLFHHGRFSFSPVRMTQGTVEIVYHLLLAPFAFSRRALFSSGYALALSLGLAHLLAASSLSKEKGVTACFFALLAFATSFEWCGGIMAGFGAALPSAFLTVAACLYARGRRRAALAMAACLPLIRPDAIAFSFAFFAAHAWCAKRFPFRAALAALGALGLYSVGCKLFYGHWIPTPALYKSAGMLESWKDLPSGISAFAAKLAQPGFAVAFFVAFVGLFLPKDETKRFLGALFLASAAVSLVFDASIPTTMTLLDRYSLPFLSVTLLSASVWIASVFRRIPSFVAAPLLAIFLALYGCALATEARNGFGRRTGASDAYAAAGRFAAESLPIGPSVATPQLNAFGFMNDHDIIDIWGYTSRDIADSGKLNVDRLASRPGYFLERKPEIYWFETRITSLRPANEVIYSDDGWRPMSNLGDMREVWKSYEPTIAKSGPFTHYFLVRKDALPVFERSLFAAGCARVEEPPIDTAKWAKLYDTPPVP